MNKKIIHYTLIIFLLQFLIVKAQNTMLIEQLSNRLVTRQNFDKNNLLLNKQVFKVGQIEKLNNNYEIKVLTKMYDKNEKLKDTYTTTYSCNIDKVSIMVMILPFTNSKATKTTINTKSNNFKDLYNLDRLEDIELDLNFESGMLNFIGSKSRIKFYDRRLDTIKGKVFIKSKLTAKAYAFGLKIKQIEYNITEELNAKGFLINQKFTETNGSFFIVNYK